MVSIVDIFLLHTLLSLLPSLLIILGLMNGLCLCSLMWCDIHQGRTPGRISGDLCWSPLELELENQQFNLFFGWGLRGWGKGGRMVAVLYLWREEDLEGRGVTHELDPWTRLIFHLLLQPSVIISLCPGKGREQSTTKTPSRKVNPSHSPEKQPTRPSNSFQAGTKWRNFNIYDTIQPFPSLLFLCFPLLSIFIY